MIRHDDPYAFVKLPRSREVFRMHKAHAALATFGLSAVLLSSQCIVPQTNVYADTQTEIVEEPSTDNLQAKVEETAQALADAEAKSKAADDAYKEHTQKLEQLKARMPRLRAQAASSLKTLYRMSCSGASLLNLVLSAHDFNDFITMMQYLNIVQTKNNEAITKLTRAVTEMQNTQKALEEDKRDKEAAVVEAKKRMDEAVAARKRAEELAAERARAEAAAAAAAEAEAAAAQGQSFTTAQGNTVTVEASSKGIRPEALDVDRDDFVAKWAPRIDRYLAGSPLAGHGATFAKAAWDKGVDPRWSPAISTIESSKGAVCFRPHNAWGWGNSSWSDWDSAIYAHVGGLAKGYGSAPTPSAARKYCPPNASFWYANCVSEMNKI